MAGKLPYSGTALVAFGDAAEVTLGSCGCYCECDCGFYSPPPDPPPIIVA